MGTIMELVVWLFILAVFPIFIVYLPIGYFRERIKKSKLKRKQIRELILIILAFFYIYAVIIGSIALWEYIGTLN